MSGILQLAFWMLVIACVAFAPLAYFIYQYIAKKGEPFGDTEPHADSASPLLETVESLINSVKGLVIKKS